MGCVVPDFSQLSQSQIVKGVERVLKSSFDRGVPPLHIRLANQAKLRNPGSNSKAIGRNISDNSDMFSQYSLDNPNRKEKRDERASARGDLRKRFSQYKRVVMNEKVDYFQKIKILRSVQNQTLHKIRNETKAAMQRFISNDIRAHFTEQVEIYIEGQKREVTTKELFHKKCHELRTMRHPSLSWREWLFEQANLGEQAALSVLRGIVYQAQRDAKQESINTFNFYSSESDTEESNEQKYQKALKLLLEEEKNEIAIRPFRRDSMRPFQIDSLLLKYAGIQWRVTGNGNVVYRNHGNEHLFTDRGNRITFDREHVTDEEIVLALMHSYQKFGSEIFLTGSSFIFKQRMARLATDEGMTILNPELQSTIKIHQNIHHSQELDFQNTIQTSIEQEYSDDTVNLNERSPIPLPQEEILGTQVIDKDQAIKKTALLSSEERMRSLVLSIDPRAKFITPDVSHKHKTYSGPVVATLTTDDIGQVFAQHVGRGMYVIHSGSPPEHHNNANIEIQYRNGLAVENVVETAKGKTR